MLQKYGIRNIWQSKISALENLSVGYYMLVIVVKFNCWKFIVFTMSCFLVISATSIRVIKWFYSITDHRLFRFISKGVWYTGWKPPIGSVESVCSRNFAKLFSEIFPGISRQNDTRNLFTSQYCLKTVVIRRKSSITRWPQIKHNKHAGRPLSEPWAPFARTLPFRFLYSPRLVRVPLSPIDPPARHGPVCISHVRPFSHRILGNNTPGPFRRFISNLFSGPAMFHVLSRCQPYREGLALTPARVELRETLIFPERKSTRVQYFDGFGSKQEEGKKIVDNLGSLVVGIVNIVNSIGACEGLSST